MIDFITKLPLAAGKDAILVVCNQNNAFFGNHRKNIGRKTGKIVQEQCVEVI